MENKSLWTFKIGLFIVVLSWFIFTLYQFGKTIFNGVDVPFTDVPGSIGFGFRVAASFIALITLLFYMAKRDFTKTEAISSLRWVVLLEAAYWIFFLPSGIWGFQYSSPGFPTDFFIIETGIPCIVEAIVMSTVLVVLFFKLSPTKPPQSAIRWALIAAAANISVFWFNYTTQWWSEIYLQGFDFLGQSILYAFEFALTIGGLLFLAVLASFYAKNFSLASSLAGLNLRRAGAIVTGLGLYFDVILLLSLLAPNTSNLLTVWPTFIIDHNVDLWMATLPVLGLPLIFAKKGA